MPFSIFSSNITFGWRQGGMLCSALSFGCIHFSPALGSIFLGLTLAAGMGSLFFEEKIRLKVPFFLLALALLFVFQVLINWGFHTDGYSWSDKILLKAPLLLFPLLLPWKWKRSDIIIWLVVINLPLTWISLASVVNYIAHFPFYNQMVLESKPIPIYSNVYHIEFSVVLATAALLGILNWWRFRQDKSAVWLWLLFGCSLINVVNLHVLSARTGIIAFWFGLFASFLVLRPWKHFATWKIVLAIGLCIIAMFSVPSVRNRIANSVEDITSTFRGENLNDKSFGRRWMAWKAASTGISKEPWSGFGLQNVQPAMEWAHVQNKTPLEASNRILPHNQYLETALQSGIIGLVLFLICVIGGLISAVRNKNTSLVSLLAAFALACVFESLLERQAGVLLFAVLLPFACNWQNLQKEG